MPCFGEVVNEGVIASVGDIIKVLDADDFGKGLGFGELLRRVTVLRPMWRMRPCCFSSMSTFRGSAIDPGSGAEKRNRPCGG